MLYGRNSKVMNVTNFDRVLILIFLENALRRQRRRHISWPKSKVLILIFLENALRLVTLVVIPGTVLTVLILIFLENALRQRNK